MLIPPFDHLPRPGNALHIVLLALASLAAFPHAFAENDPPIQQHYDITLAELLDENGNIELPDGFSGSIDPTGFTMASEPGEAPRFVRSAATNDQWSEGEFPVPGCDESVNAIIAINGELFLGGRFQACGLILASNIARFDPSTGEFSSLGEGLNFEVNALTAIGKDLFVGGAFSSAGGVSARNIAVYDTTQTGNAGWAPLGDGVDRRVQALTAIGDDLYVGGEFTQAGGAPANRIARYDTAQMHNSGWSALGDGVNNHVSALVAIGDDLYVGGRFSQAGGAPANAVAVYDSTQTGNSGWSALGDGVSFQVFALIAVDTDLYVGGSFSTAGGIPTRNVAVYDTNLSGNAAWSALGDGTDGEVRAMSAISNNLYLAGTFNQVGNTAAEGIAVYDTEQNGNAGWSSLGDGVNIFPV